ncbi:MAG: hypothetical protein VB070_12225 [Clostridiaceae bacterium]|nr:hypothetical protein [Clostridiaceae bacterium]
MTIPFFDSNPEIVNELRAMDHNTKEYRKLMQKVLLDIGGPVILIKTLKTTDGGMDLRKSYLRNMIITGVFLLSLFIWIAVTVALTGGRDIGQFNESDKAIFIIFIAAELGSVIMAIFFLFVVSACCCRVYPS